MHQKFSLFFVLIFVFIQACNKKIVPTKNVPFRTAERVTFNYLQGKAQVSYQHGKVIRKIKTNIRIKKDSVIWMNFSFLGISVGRININRDSITVLNHLDKEYYSLNYKKLSTRFRFKIDYSLIESILLGNFSSIKKRHPLYQKSAHYSLENRKAGIKIIRQINANSLRIEQLELQEIHTNNRLIIGYDDFSLKEDQLPHKINIRFVYHTEKMNLNEKIFIVYSSIDISNKEIKFPFRIPWKYEHP